MEKFKMVFFDGGLTLTPRQELEDLEDIMFEFGDSDIISCNEINEGDGYRVIEGSSQVIYELTPQNQKDLFNGQETTLNAVSKLKAEVDLYNETHRRFLQWFFPGVKDFEAIIKLIK